MRVFALLMVYGIFQAFLDVADPIRQAPGALLWGAAKILLLSAVGLTLWFRVRDITATSKGLEVGSGRSVRQIPWGRVVDVREMPWMRFSPPWYPKMFQVDLRGGEAFDFVGVRDSREIVRQFVARAEEP
jgi:hypothetical protein